MNLQNSSSPPPYPEAFGFQAGRGLKPDPSSCRVLALLSP